jgi:KilA-N domain
MQLNLVLIPHRVGREIIEQRVKDGYVNATALCKAAGRPWSRYWDARPSRDFAEALSAEIGISISELIQSVKGGDIKLQGTWVHPQVAIHLAQWLSPEFAVKVSGWVYKWMSGHGQPAKVELPYHIRRYVINSANVPPGHFSILVETIHMLIGPMEMLGYTLPESMIPDIALGLMFCKWLRDKAGIDTDQLPTYTHDFEDGRRVPAKAYPDTLLGAFRKHFREEWFPLRAEAYFRKRDPEALPYLPKVLAIAKPGAPIRRVTAQARLKRKAG